MHIRLLWVPRDIELGILEINPTHCLLEIRTCRQCKVVSCPLGWVVQERKQRKNQSRYMAVKKPKPMNPKWNLICVYT